MGPSLPALALSLVLLGLPFVSSGKISSLWVFGDEYVDVGTGAYMPNIFRQCAIAPYGQNTQAPTGRCSNGKILTDYLGAQLGTVIGPYDGPEAFLANGVAFAAAGAGALRETNPGKTVDMATQISQFEGYLAKKNLAGQLNESMVTLAFGMNDYLQAILGGADPMAYVDRVVGRLVNGIKRIQKISNAYRFFIVGVPPLGCIPYVRQRFYSPPETCLTNLNAVNEFHEQRLMLALDNLVNTTRAQDGSQTFFYSAFLLSKAMLDPLMGFPAFSKPWVPACGLVSKDGVVYGCGQNVTYTENGQQMTAPVTAPQMSGYDYFWWDWFNPTENAFYTLWVAAWLGSNPQLIYPTSVLKLTFC